MKKRIEVTADLVRDLFSYDRETGVIRYRNCYFRSKNGSVAGRLAADGYWTIFISEHPYQSHRIAWLIETGAWPVGLIDHINGDRTDNRWVNLRDSTHLINQQNLRGPHSDNRVGLLGVSRHGKTRFRATIKVDGKHVYLGTHKTAESAHAAYVEAKRRLHEGCTL